MEKPVEQIKQFLRAVQTRRRLFIVVSACVAVLGVSASFFVPKVYEAQSTVFIESNVLKSLMKGITITPSMDDRIRVLRYYMLSRDMLTRTLKDLDVDADPRYVDAKEFEGLVKKLQEETQIRIRGNDLFFVSLVDPNPYFAKDYINTLVNNYVEENLSEKREESYGASRFLAEQVTFYKQKLDEIEAKITEFRKKTGIYSTVNEATIMEQLAADEDLLKQIRGQKSEVFATIKTIRRQLEMLRETTALGYTAFTSDTGGGSGEDARIQQLQAKIDDLLLVYNDQYPTVIKLRDQIEELRKRQTQNQASQVQANSVANVEQTEYNPVEDPIYVDLKMRMNAAQSDLNALAARESELQEEIEKNQELLRNFPEDKKALNALLNEKVMQAEIYNKLMERVGVSEVSQQMEVADKATTFRIVDPAILPPKPVGPPRLFFMAVGILAGLVAGLGAVYLAEQLDGSIKKTQDLRDLGLNVLIEIPWIRSAGEIRKVRRKDRAAWAFAGVCTVLIGVMFLHDILGMSFIDQIVGDLDVKDLFS